MQRLILSIATVAVVLTAAGLAAGALKETSATYTVGPAEAAEGIAECEGNKRVVSGGFSGPELVEGGPVILPVDSTREGRRGWRAREFNFGTADEATAYGYCGGGIGKLKAKSKSATLGPDELAVVKAKCKRGGEAVAGGFDMPDPEGAADLVVVVSSKRGGKRAWKAKFFNGFLDSQEVTTEVYCLKGKAGLKTKSKSVEQSPGESSSVAAKCKRGQQLLSGGFTSEFSDVKDISSLVFVSRRTGKRKWEVSGFGQGGNAKLKALAYCQP
jgi:hypothetical protein